MNDNIRKAILAELKSARDIADAAEAGSRDLTAEERVKVAAHMKMAGDLKARDVAASDMRQQLADLSDGIGLDDPAPGDQKAAPDTYNVVGAGQKGKKSLGESFVESAEFQALIKSAPDGRFSKNARVQSSPFGVKDLITGLNRTTGAGTLLTPDRLGMLDPFYQRPLTIRDLVTPGRTQTDTIEYVRMTTVTNNAAPVPEATSAGVIGTGGVTAVTGGLKPESGMAFEKATTNVKTIAHWMPATKRALSDAGQVRTLIDNFLLYGLDEELENQMVSGDGVGENLLGVGATSGVQTQGLPGVGENVFHTTRRARTKVRLFGRAVPTAFVFNPIDWERIDLMRDANDRFYGAGPFAMSVPTLWGLPVVESETMTPGTGWCADWRQAVLWDREQASIQVTDSHADFFIRNLVAILAELRAAFAVLRPPAFVRITLPV